jgi:hypothetical protein
LKAFRDKLVVFRSSKLPYEVKSKGPKTTSIPQA